MKKIARSIGLSALLLLLCTPAEAQLLKKLGKRAEKAVERTILNRTDKEVSKGTDKAIDGVLKKEDGSEQDTIEEDKLDDEDGGAFGEKLKDLFGGLGDPQDGAPQSGKAKAQLTPETLEKALAEADPAPEDQNIQLPDTYNFSYQLTTEVSNHLGKQEGSYLLEPGKSYYAERTAQPGGTKYVIYDDKNMTVLHFSENSGSREFWREKMSIFTAIRMLGAYKDGDNMKTKTIDNKNILGFDTQGYEISTDDGVLKIWVTHDAPATLFGALFSERSKVKESPFQANAMILEMKYSSAGNPDKSYQWSCTALKPQSKTFDITSYN